MVTVDADSLKRPIYQNVSDPLAEKAVMRHQKSLIVWSLLAAAVIGTVATPAQRAYAAPAPEVEYVYDVMVRRHYNFPNNDAIGYGHGICDKVAAGENYAQVMGDVKRDVTPNDEYAANYLVSYAVNILCPEQIWQLRNSATHYRPSEQ
jgi:hypothetical protein